MGITFHQDQSYQTVMREVSVLSSRHNSLESRCDTAGLSLAGSSPNTAVASRPGTGLPPNVCLDFLEVEMIHDPNKNEA